MGEELVKHDPSQSLALQKVAQGLFQSNLFPNAKNAAGAFAIVEYGHELGVPPMMSLKNINIISGQLACNGQLMLTLAMRKGVTYEVLEETTKGCKITFKRPGQKDITVEFNESDAREAGLLGKDNWKKYPKDMYFWRTVAKGVRRIAPDAVFGLYTADEISSGEVIDVSQVANQTEEKPEQETLPQTPQEESPKPPTKQKEDFSAILRRECDRLGPDRFYDILRDHGFETAEEIIDRPKQIEIYKALSSAKA